MFADSTKEANALGIAALILKGCVGIVSPQDSLTTCRMVFDLDILVAPEGASELYHALIGPPSPLKLWAPQPPVAMRPMR